MAKMIETICPCCSERIVVDPETRRAWPAQNKPKEPEEASGEDAFDAALQSVKDGVTDSEERFRKALDSEAHRGDRLDEAFRKAQEEADKSGDEKPHNPLDWD